VSNAVPKDDAGFAGIAMRPMQLELPTVRLVSSRLTKRTVSLSGHRHVVAGLFAGIGGIELGLHRAGHRSVLLCDNDPAAIAVLEENFGGIARHDDICTLKRLPAETTLVTAGFPCQDLSQAGMTKGISGKRSGLVGEVFRLIEEQRTPWVLIENVPFMLQLGRGEAMHVITSALEDLGYKWAYRVIDSRAFGLPQRRRRVYLVACLEGDPRTVLFADDHEPRTETTDGRRSPACGFYWTEGLRGLGWAVDAVPTLKGGSSIGIPSPPAIVLSDGRVVTPGIVDTERLQGFPSNWTKAADTVGRKSTRWKLVGNAVSVRAATWLGRKMIKPGVPRDFNTAPLHDHRHWPTAAWNVGEGRFRVEASEWPARWAYKSLEQFLTKRRLAPLSWKATRGFLSRTKRAKLIFPEGFIEALETHLEIAADGAKTKKTRRARTTT
jgi:DNA (cytosine-5)-methyltransferase 1